MKFGVLSDIHGNIPALNEALKEFEKRNVDKILCCGDLIGIGPEPNKAVQKIIEIKDKVICVRGNHEGYLLDGIPKIIHDRPMTEIERVFHQWTQDALSNEVKRYLETLPYEKYIDIYGKKIYISHYPYGENREFKRHIFVPNVDECKELFSDIKADVYIFGHTHNEVDNSFEGKKYINPGSLGCPCASRKAFCGILELNENEMKYEQLRLDYDVDFVINEIKQIQYPYYKTILKDFYGEGGE